MWALYRKEISQYFSSLGGIIAIAVFLIVNGLVLFVFEDNLLDFGYATLDRFFELSPWILLLLVPAITMRSFAEEFRTGTWEVLRTQPITLWQLMLGKYLGALFVVVIALVPTFFYAILLQGLAADPGLDWGATLGCFIRKDTHICPTKEGGNFLVVDVAFKHMTALCNTQRIDLGLINTKISIGLARNHKVIIRR